GISECEHAPQSLARSRRVRTNIRRSAIFEAGELRQRDGGLWAMPFVVGKLPRNAPCQRALLVLVPPLLADVGRRASTWTRTRGSTRRHQPNPAGGDLASGPQARRTRAVWWRVKSARR